jgi:hypothetical protein
MSGIQLLPIELLQRIFICGCEIDENPFSSLGFSIGGKAQYLSVDDHPKNRSEAKLRNIPQLKYFAEAPKAVCRFWKQIILKTDELWYLAFRIEFWWDAAPEMEKALANTGSVEIDLYLMYFSRMKGEHVPQVKKLLRDHRSRIRMIQVKSPPGRCWTENSELLNSFKDLPNLEFLGITVSHDKYGVKPTQMAPFEFAVRTPALRIATIAGLPHNPFHVTPRPRASKVDDVEDKEDFHMALWSSPNASSSSRLRFMHLEMVWTIFSGSNAVDKSPTLDFPFLTGLRIAGDSVPLLAQLARLRLPRVESMTICNNVPYGYDQQTSPLPSIVLSVPSLEVLIIGGASYISFSQQLKGCLDAPRLKVVECSSNVTPRLERSNVKLRDAPRGQLANKLLEEGLRDWIGFIFEMTESTSDGKQTNDLVVTCSRYFALDCLDFFPLANVSRLTFCRSPRSKETILQGGETHKLSGDLSMLKHIAVFDFIDYNTGPQFQSLFRRVSSAHIRVPDSKVRLKLLFEGSPVESLHLIASVKEDWVPEALAELDTIPVYSKVLDLVRNPNASTRSVVTLPKLKHLSVSCGEDFSSPEHFAALGNMLKSIVSVRANSKSPLKTLAVDRFLIEKLEVHCTRNGVRYYLIDERSQ